MQALASAQNHVGGTRIIAHPDSREQRAHIRWSGDAPHRVLVDHGQRAFACGLKDISAGGAALTGRLDVAVGHLLVLEINDYLRLPAVVVRVQPDRIAVRFTLPKSLSAVIEQAIELGIGPDRW